MKARVLYILREEGGRATLETLKERMMEEFESELNHRGAGGRASVWESTMLKVLKSEKREIDSRWSKTVFALD